MSSHFVPLVSAHSDGELRVVIIGRKSKPNPDNENESIEASIEDAEAYLRRVYRGKSRITRLGEQISDMVVDRATIRQVKDMISAGEVDLVLTEDMGRIFRNPRHMYDFVQNCVDAEVRVIAVADNLDTADETWEAAISMAASRHGFQVSDASRRVKRSAKYSSRKGGNVKKIKMGYRKLSKEEAASGKFGPPDLRMAKIDEMTPVIMDLRRKIGMFDEYPSYEDIAEEARLAGVKGGSYAKDGVITARSIVSLMRDKILIGYKTHGRVNSKRIYGSGKHKRRRNPNPEETHFPSLAHMTVPEFDEVQVWMDQRAARQRGKKGREHPRFDIPRSKSIFPAQHMRCICGEIHYPCGRKEFKCKRTFKESLTKCWNHVQVDRDLARQRVVGWVLRQLDSFPGFRETLADFCWEEYQRLLKRHHGSVDVWNQQITRLQREESRLAKAIRLTDEIETLAAELKDVHGQLVAARKQRDQALACAAKEGTFRSRDDVTDRLDDVVRNLTESSFKFADLLRRILVRFEIAPVQALDTPLVRPRARLTLAIAVDGGSEKIVRTIEGVIDLFDPPLHIQHMAACLEERRKATEENRKMSYVKIADRLGINYMTVKRALDYAHLMEREGVSDPYRELTSPPANASRWKSA